MTINHIIVLINCGVVILCFMYLYRLTKVKPFILIGLSHLSSLTIRVLCLIEPLWNGTYITMHSSSLNWPTHIIAFVGYFWLYKELKKFYSPKRIK
jgi:hypothetical protein